MKYLELTIREGQQTKEVDMTVEELEYKVWEQDQIRIVVRAPGGSSVGDYPQVNAAQENCA